MKKTLTILSLIIAVAFCQASYAQNSPAVEETASGFSSKYAGHLFDGISGIMIYSLHSNNNLVMAQYQNKLMSQDSALGHAIYLERASKYVLELVQAKIDEDGAKKELKKGELKYLKDLKSTLIIIGGQSRNLKEYVNGDMVAKRRFDLNNNTARRKVNNILTKE